MPIRSNDRRPSCGNTSIAGTKKFLGGCNQRFNRDNSHIPVLRNVTKVPSYYTENLGEPIDPYKRPYNTTPCDDYYSSLCYPEWWCGDGTNNHEYCGIPQSTDFYPCEESQSSFDIGPWHNCYEETNETMSLSSCKTQGYYKKVFAWKYWQGRYSYTSRMNNNTDYMQYCCDIDGFPMCVYHNYDPTHDTTKYLTISAEAEWSQESRYYPIISSETTYVDCGDYEMPIYCLTLGDPSTTTITANASAFCSVDKYGNVIAYQISSSSDPSYINQAKQYLSKVDGTSADAILAYCGAQPENVMPDVITGGGMDWHLEYHTFIQVCDDCGNNCTNVDYAWLIIDIAGGNTVTIQHFSVGCLAGCSNSSGCTTVYQSGIETYTISDLSVSWTLNGIFRSSSRTYEEITNASMTGHMSDPYPESDVQEDMEFLLSQWDLGDDAMYPWQIYPSNKKPVVHYNEIPRSPSTAWTENESGYGDMIGAPAPLGIDRVWSPDHANYCIITQPCSCGDPGKYLYVQTYGAWSTECGVPRATAWLDDFDASNLPDKAFTLANCGWTVVNQCAYNCLDTNDVRIIDDRLWGGKYAEVIYPKQSFNYARPCGVDKYQVAENKKLCATGSYNNIVAVEPTGPDTTDIPVNGYVWVCSVGGVTDGCYQVDAKTAYSVQLGQCIATASILPWSPVYECGSGMIGPLRWQTLQPAICGRIQIDSIESGSVSGSVTCSLQDPSWLANNEIITILSASTPQLNNTWTAIIIDNQHIALSGSNGNGWSPYVSGSGQMKSLNSKDWKWDDVGTKNDFISLSWMHNFRDIGEYTRLSEAVPSGNDCNDPNQYCPTAAVPPMPRPNTCGMPWSVEYFTAEDKCLPYSACKPSVAYWSPNEESFNTASSAINSAINLGWTTVGIDTQYRTLWQGAVKQTVDDYLGNPYSPCPCVFVEDLEYPELSYYDCNCTWLPSTLCENDIDLPELGICIKYYPAIDQFEARNSPPTGAPALPSDADYIGYLSQAQYQANYCEGNIAMPPVIPNENGGNGGGYWSSQCTEDGCDGCEAWTDWDSPWMTFLQKQQCVDAGGRFDEYYIRNGITSNFVSPP